MPHQIMISFAVDVDAKFKELTGPTDAVRGEPVKLSIFVTNVGKEDFPGGKAKSLRITYGNPPGGFTSWTEEWDCPHLSPSSMQRVLSESTVPMLEGLAWVYLTLVAVDDQAIEYYQTRVEPLVGKAEWSSCFYVVNREILLLLARLAPNP